MPFLTLEDKIELENNPVYLKYKNTALSAVTQASILADLNLIKSTSLETLPLIKFLSLLAEAKAQGDQNALLTTIDTDTGLISTNVVDIEEQVKDSRIWFQGWNGPTAYASNTTMALRYGTTALSSGTGSINLLAPGAGKKYHVLWCQISCDIAAAAGGQTLLVDFQEETAGSFMKQAFNTNATNPAFFYVNSIATTADKDFILSITGGAASENIYAVCMAGTF